MEAKKWEKVRNGGGTRRNLINIVEDIYMGQFPQDGNFAHFMSLKLKIQNLTVAKPIKLGLIFQLF